MIGWVVLVDVVRYLIKELETYYDYRYVAIYLLFVSAVICV